jgi:thiol-disulfide isomerase/thioredoxin
MATLGFYDPRQIFGTTVHKANYSILREKHSMKAAYLICSVSLMISLFGALCRAEVDLEILGNISVNAVPVDVSVSEDGRWIYVLTDRNRLNIYAPDGALKGSVAVPEGSQRIVSGPGNDIVFLMNNRDQKLQVVRVNLEHSFTWQNSPSLGPADAPVTLVLFTDFECTYCARLAPVLDQVHQRYPKDVRIVFKNFPLRSHRFAAQAAMAALAAHDQGQFWPFHDRLFQHYNRLNLKKVEEIREELGLDADRFEAKMKEPALQGLIRRDMAEGNAAGVSGTPAVFINGKRYRGARSLEAFQGAIEPILAQKN